MNRAWHPDELAQCWTLNPDELELLGSKTGVTRLRFAVLLKAFQFDGRFPDRRADLAGSVVAHLASQIGVPAEAYFDGEWSERTQRHQRAQIRKHFGFRPFRARDESVLVGWLSQRVGSFNPETEALKLAAYDHLRSRRIEPPTPERLRRLLGMTVRQREERFVEETFTQLSSQTRAALDALVKRQMPENDGDAEQRTLFPIRSDLAVIKEGAGALKVETVLDEIAKLEQLRALACRKICLGRAAGGRGQRGYLPGCQRGNARGRHS